MVNSKEFNPSRLKLARERRKMTYKALAEAVGMSSKMMSHYENSSNEHPPTELSISKIASTLKYPVDFFFGDEVEDIDVDTVAFRSMKSMKANQQNAALGAGKISLMLNDFFLSNFNKLPVLNVPSFKDVEPEIAAQMLRDAWGLGDRSIRSVVGLLESNGVRVFSLAENAQEVDAFSFWKGDVPFVLLNTQKSGERGRFDAAHELGHLVMHRNRETKGRDIEQQADAFASAFLMPKTAIYAVHSAPFSVSRVLKLKKLWNVSAMALTHRLKSLGLVTEWQYRSAMIDLSKMGYRTTEKDGIERENSVLIPKLLSALADDGIRLPHIASTLGLPIEEVSSLLFKLTVLERNEKPVRAPITKPKLYIVN
jgi:Zn-dependent peptidase ImmA (M78 family)/transcriptional regulator with XRE-family HTH domain